MPTRSLTSSVLKWPSRDAVERELRRWASQTAKGHPDLVRLGVFGSYARGDAGVGSDLDIVAIVHASDRRPEERTRGWDTTSLPVPVDLLVYTEEEWARVRTQSRFGVALTQEALWLYERGSEVGARPDMG
jgi:hypothetical protein